MANVMQGGSHPASQLKSEHEILTILRPIYSELGGNPSELVKVTPSWGGWLNALRFCVSRADGATAWVTRGDLDSLHKHELAAALSAFSCTSEAHRPTREHAVSQPVDDRNKRLTGWENAASSRQG